MERIRVDVAPSAESIPREAWERLCPAAHPFLNADFFAITERHGAANREWGWRAMHLVARDDAGTVCGVLPLYLKSNGYGDFIHDWAWAGAYERLGKAYYPRLVTGLAHTPATGPRILVGCGVHADEMRSALIAAARQIAGEMGVSSWHVGFPEAHELEALSSVGLLTSVDVQYHWRNEGHADFESYLGSFASVRRRKVRAERKRVAESGLTIEVRHGNEVERAEWPALHALYASTFEKFQNHAVFTAECFADLAEALGRRMVLFIARAGTEPVALSLCYRSDEALYGRYWGTRVEVDSLHFEMCFYQGIAYCLREGLQRFEPGAGGEHKIARGFQPTIVRSAHWVADESMRRLIARHLAAEHEAVARYREDAATHLPFRKGDA
jgi:predicted N-acyltransferase